MRFFAQAALALLVGLGGGWLVGPDNIFYLLGTVGTLVYVVVYTLGNIGVVRFFLTVRRQDFNPVIHLIFPVISTIALFVVAYYSLVPLPAPPVSYAPLVTAVVLLLGFAVLLKLQHSGKQDWRTLSKAVVELDDEGASRV